VIGRGEGLSEGQGHHGAVGGLQPSGANFMFWAMLSEPFARDRIAGAAVQSISLQWQSSDQNARGTTAGRVPGGAAWILWRGALAALGQRRIDDRRQRGGK